MSFLSGSKKSQFYVEFLGWMECRGLRGRKYVDPVISELRRRQRKVDTPPRLTIQVSRKELKISQDIEDSKKRAIKKIKFPTIPARDITYIYQMKSSDVVACIYLGYMPRTQRYVHVHVYRFDGVETATTFNTQMTQMIEGNLTRIREVEIDLANKGEIDDPRLTSSDGMSEPHTTDSVESAVGSASSNCSDDDIRGGNRFDIDPDLQSLKDVQAFDNVAEELRFRLQIKEAPLLLPPKDYDTISRAQGNLTSVNLRRCMNLDIVGANALTNADSPRARNSSTESGVDLTSPTATISDRGDGDRNSQSSHPPLGPSSSFTLSDSFRSGPSTPGTPPVEVIGYPAKTATPPMSPQVTQLRRPLNRQSSHSSFHSEGSRHSQHSDTNEDHVVIYKGGNAPVGDIYAQPMKPKSVSMALNNSSNNNSAAYVNSNLIPPQNAKQGTSLSPRVDYHGASDDTENFSNGDVMMRSSGPRYRQPILTRSMPADLIRSEMALGSSSPRTSRDSRELVNSHMRRPMSPSFVGHNPYSNAYPLHEQLFSSSGRLNSYR